MLTAQLINCKYIQVYKCSQGLNRITLLKNKLLLLNVPFTTFNHLLAYTTINHTVIFKAVKKVRTVLIYISLTEERVLVWRTEQIFSALFNF